MSNEVTVYSTKVCPRCKVLKKFLESIEVEYGVMDMSLPEALTELRMNGVFTLEAPVLQVDDDFYIGADMFDDEGHLWEESVETVVGVGGDDVGDIDGWADRRTRRALSGYVGD